MSCSSRSLFSHSEALLAAPSPSSATGGPDVLPTSVVARKTRTAWLHRSASSSAVLVRSLPRVGPGSYLASPKTAAQRDFCWHRHCGWFLNRCSRVWMLYWHHQHFTSGRLAVHWRYCPVMQWPVFSFCWRLPLRVRFLGSVSSAVLRKAIRLATVRPDCRHPGPGTVSRPGRRTTPFRACESRTIPGGDD